MFPRLKQDKNTLAKAFAGEDFINPSLKSWVMLEDRKRLFNQSIPFQDSPVSNYFLNTSTWKLPGIIAGLLPSAGGASKSAVGK